MKQSYILNPEVRIKAAKYFCLSIPLGEANPPQKALTAIPARRLGGRPGKLRLDIEKQLFADRLVKRVVG